MPILTFYIDRTNHCPRCLVKDGHNDLGSCATEGRKVTRVPSNIGYIYRAFLCNGRTRSPFVIGNSGLRCSRAAEYDITDHSCNMIHVIQANPRIILSRSDLVGYCL